MNTVFFFTLVWFFFKVQCGDIQFSCDFESGTCEDSINILRQRWFWVRTTGTTAVPGTGPRADHTTKSKGGHYLLADASMGRQGQVAGLTFDGNGAGHYCVEFYYHMYGRNVGKLQIYLKENKKRVMLWQKIKNQSTEWQFDQIDINARTANPRFQVQALRGSGSKGDIAIDDLVLRKEPCFSSSDSQVIDGCDFETDFCSFKQSKTDNADWKRNSGQTPTVSTGPKYDHTKGSKGKGKYAYIESSSPNRKGDIFDIQSKTYSETGKLCLSFWYHMHGKDTESLTVIKVDRAERTEKVLWVEQGEKGVNWLEGRLQFQVYKPFGLIFRGTRGDDYQGDIAIDDYELSHCPPEVSSPYDCNFDKDMCRWKTSSSSFKFVRLKGRTPSSQTGPTEDHTGGGYYVYVEASKNSNANTELISPEISEQVCLTFWYHMYVIKTTDPLESSLEVITTKSSSTTIWRLIGHQSESWQRAIVPITEKNKYQIRFRATIGKNVKNDIAIDDIHITNYSTSCQLSPIEANVELPPKISRNGIVMDCNFESDFCGMTVSRSTAGLYWKRFTGRSQTPATGPASDHTYGQSRKGYYIVMDTTAGQRDQTTDLTMNLPVTGDYCLKFYYTMYGTSVKTLKVLHKQNGQYIQLWSKFGSQSQKWLVAEVDFNVTVHGSQLLLQGTKGNGYRGDIALDDLLLKRGECGYTVIDYCDFETDICRFKQVKSDYKDWIRRKGKTPTSNTGPDKDHTTLSESGYYMYVEATGIPRGRRHDLLSGVYSEIGTICVSVRYHMYGKRVGILRILKTDKTGVGATHEIWKKSGDQGNNWYEANLELHALTPFRILFRVETDGSALGDVAIDDYEVAKCKPHATTTVTTVPTTATTRMTRRVQRPILKKTILVTRPTTLYTKPPTTTTRSTAPSTRTPTTKTTTGRTTDQSTTEMGSTTPYRKFDISTTDPDVPVSCTFEFDLCGFTASSRVKGFMWKISSGNQNPTISRDHTVNSTYGHYLLMKASVGSFLAQTNLELNLRGKLGDFCLRFYYMMNNEDVYRLWVTRLVSGRTKGRPIWDQEGRQSYDWQQAEVDITLLEGQSVAIAGQIATINSSDIAIDDLTVSRGKCSGTSTSMKKTTTITIKTTPGTQKPFVNGSLLCTFELGSCGFKVTGVSENMNWKVSSGRLTPGVRADHTLRTKDGHFLLMDTNHGNLLHRTELEVEVADADYYCLRFYYLMNGTDVYRLRVTFKQSDGVSVLWDTRGHQSDEWLLAEKTLEVKETGAALVFVAYKGTDYPGSDIAIDDVEISKGSCPNRTSVMTSTISMTTISTTPETTNTNLKYTTTTILPTTSHNHDFTCSFENGLCGLTVTGNSDANMNWNITSGHENPRLDKDHTLHSKDGHYLLMNTDYGDMLKHTQLIYEIQAPGEYCLQFFYYMNDRNAYQLRAKHNSRRSRPLWQRSGPQGAEWLFAELNINSPVSNKQVIVTGVKGAGRGGDIALDDFSITTGTCPMTTTTWPMPTSSSNSATTQQSSKQTLTQLNNHSQSTTKWLEYTSADQPHTTIQSTTVIGKTQTTGSRRRPPSTHLASQKTDSSTATAYESTSIEGSTPAPRWTTATSASSQTTLSTIGMVNKTAKRLTSTRATSITSDLANTMGQSTPRQENTTNMLKPVTSATAATPSTTSSTLNSSDRTSHDTTITETPSTPIPFSETSVPTTERPADKLTPTKVGSITIINSTPSQTSTIDRKTATTSGTTQESHQPTTSIAAPTTISPITRKKIIKIVPKIRGKSGRQEEKLVGGVPWWIWAIVGGGSFVLICLVVGFMIRYKNKSSRSRSIVEQEHRPEHTGDIMLSSYSLSQPFEEVTLETD